MKKEIEQLWRKLGESKQAMWPRMEQGQYRSYRAVHPFDERFGVETSGLLYELPTGHPHDLYNNGYFAVAPSVFHAVIGNLRQQLHLDFQRFDFVDIGSGKGRALLLASDYPFREIVGIELSPELDRIARANVARYAEVAAGVESGMRVPQVITIQGDAAEFVWPSTPLIVYMWNAFTMPVMERVFHSLKASLVDEPREVYLVYMHPELESMLDELPWLVRLWRDEFAMSEEDFAAWAFPTRTEMCAVYRTTFARHTKV